MTTNEPLWTTTEYCDSVLAMFAGDAGRQNMVSLAHDAIQAHVLKAAHEAAIMALEAAAAKNTALRERLHHQVMATQDAAVAFEAGVRDKWRHFGQELPEIDGPIDQAVSQWFYVIKTKLEAAEKRATEAEDKTNTMLCQAVDDFMRDALVAIAGAVCTPENGYIEDGGLQLLLSDIKRLRQRHDELQRDLESVNQIARDYGYGQGEIDGDLAGCIRAIIDRATKATQEGRNEL